MIVCKLDALCEQNNVKPSDLIDKIPMNKDILCRMRHNKMNGYNMDMLDRLCTFFDCQLGDIFEYIPDDDMEDGDSNV